MHNFLIFKFLEFWNLPIWIYLEFSVQDFEFYRLGLGPSYSTSFSVSLLTGFSRSDSSTTWATKPGTLAIIKKPLPLFGWKPISSSSAAKIPSIFSGNFLDSVERDRKSTRL